MSAQIPAAAGVVGENHTAGDPFGQQRNRLLSRLIPPVEHSYLQHDELDAGSTLFDGSFDWHSAVHAALCLHILTRQTGQTRFVEVFETKNRPGAVAAEAEYMRTVEPRENPYGFAWLLALAAERQTTAGRDDLAPLAAFAETRLRALIDSLDRDEARRRVLIDSHGNLTWALIRLHHWAGHTGDTELAGWLRQRAAEILFDPETDAVLSVQSELDSPPREFFSPALMRLAAIAEIFAPEARAAGHGHTAGEIADYLTQRLPAALQVEPVRDPQTVHAYGLTFSRAYALWHLGASTGRTELQQNYVRLIQDQVLAHPDFDQHSSGGYDVSHWVPQFGIIAIDQSRPEKGQPEKSQPEDSQSQRSQPTPRRGGQTAAEVG
ncbi:DUF2891 family protein [Nesterenkonia alba]|uniref:DUF2891 family protein n=1 Tax=Nesterenkonia alba TaxID=515814 RepID=UPI0003B5C03A|nr:DUF2891 family protein [Nesterenkonia alba]